MMKWNLLHKNQLPTLLIAGLVAASSSALAQTKLYVSLVGNDKYNGLTTTTNRKLNEGPKRTIEGARDQIRKWRYANKLDPKGVEVIVLPGRYYMRRGVLFTGTDNGFVDGPIVWKAQTPGSVIIDGGRQVTVWRNLTGDAANAVAPELRSKIKVASLKSLGISKPTINRREALGASSGSMPELFFDGARMPIAQYPNGDNWLRVDNSTQPDPKVFRVDTERFKNWKFNNDLFVYGFLTQDYADNYERVQVDSNRVATLETSLYGTVKPNQPYRFVNILEEVDTPGEYAMNPKRGLIYFYPPSTIGKKAFVSFVDQPLFDVRNTQNVRFENLVFQYGRRHGMSIAGGQNVHVRGCRFYNIGVDGLKVTYSKDSVIDSNDFERIGETAITVSGGQQQTLTPGNNSVTNNWIRYSAERTRTYRPGILVQGVGQYVAYNRIENMPSMAIWLYGNNHMIERNEISNACMEVNDAGAIYQGREITGTGSVIQFNLVQGVLSRLIDPETNKPKGATYAVYLDDMQANITVRNNVFRNNSGGIVLGGGRLHKIQNNVFMDNKVDVFADARGLTHHAAMSFWTSQLAAIDVNHPAYVAQYPWLQNFLNDEPRIPKGVKIENNAYINTVETYRAWNDVLTMRDKNGDLCLTRTNNYSGGNPGFVNETVNDFRVLPGSNAAGFTGFDISSDRGLQITNYRTSVQPLAEALPRLD